MSGVRVVLPQVGLCESCGGKCCQRIGLPPFEVANPDLGPQPVPPGLDVWMLLDTELFLDMPAELRAEHAALVRDLAADPTGRPCAWLDDAGRCRHYDWRPAVCRDWAEGAEPCVETRAGRGVVWRDPEGTTTDDWRNPRRIPYAVKVVGFVEE